MRISPQRAALGAVLGFLLVTHPVVVDAAGQITSAQIKDNTIKSKDVMNDQLRGSDVKDGSLTSSDLAANTRQLSQVRRLAFEGDFALTSSRLLAAAATVTVDGNDAVVVSGSVAMAYLASSSIDLTTCLRPAGTSTEPAQLDSVDFSSVTGVSGTTSVVPVQGTGVPAAGTYEVGVCVEEFAGNANLQDVAGTVLVIDGTHTGALGP